MMSLLPHEYHNFSLDIFGPSCNLGAPDWPWRKLRKWHVAPLSFCVSFAPDENHLFAEQPQFWRVLYFTWVARHRGSMGLMEKATVWAAWEDSKGLPSGNQTWRAGKGTIYRRFSHWKLHLWGIVLLQPPWSFHCHVWLREGSMNRSCQEKEPTSVKSNQAAPSYETNTFYVHTYHTYNTYHICITYIHIHVCHMYV